MRGWRQAMGDALYGEGGFYLRPEGPIGHFRTSAHLGPLFAGAIVELLHRIDRALGAPPRLDLVDVGAGRGELLRQVHQLRAPFGSRLRLTGVDLAARPAGLAADIRWTAEIPRVTGLLLANEWLDVVPVEVIEMTAAGPRLVLVDRDGTERLGPTPADDDLDWSTRWWPLRSVGDRAEIGAGRDVAWAAAVGRVRAGTAVAVDYGHRSGDRPERGSLLGYRAGRAVRPVPDGCCDLTAHVALDSCAAAAGGAALLTTQRQALRELGVPPGRPDRAQAQRDPPGYLRGLRDAGEAAELVDPAGLGGLGWLLHPVGMALPLSSAVPRLDNGGAGTCPSSPSSTDPKGARWQSSPRWPAGPPW